MAGFDILRLDGTPIVSGQMNNLFPDVAVGGGTLTTWVMIHNPSTGPVTGVRVFLGIDPNGVTTRMAVADGTPRSGGWAPAPTPGSWSIPTESAPLTAVTGDAALPAGQRVLIAIQRDASAGAAAWPEQNRIIVTSPSGPA